jgi:hypothetical protein
VGVFHLYGSGRAIGCSHEFGGLDGAPIAGPPYGPFEPNLWEDMLPAGPDPEKLALLTNASAAEARAEQGADARTVNGRPPLAKVSPSPAPAPNATTPIDIMAAYLSILRQSAEPNIVVNVSSLADTIVEHTTGSAAFTIRNAGILASPLSFTIGENPDASWLSVSPTSDTLDPNEVVTINVTFSDSILLEGVYSSSLEIASNDPDDPIVIVPVDLVVTAAPRMIIGANSFSFTTAPGATLSQDYLFANGGKAPLTYSIALAFVSGPSGNREEFSGIQNVLTGSNRARGNVYQVTTATALTKSELYLGINQPTSLDFFVYESTTLTGTYTRIFSTGPIAVAPDTAFFVSPAMNVPMIAGRYYYIGASWNSSSRYFNDGGATGLPQPTDFGLLRFGVTNTNFYPSTPSATVNSSSVITPQAITTGFGVVTSMLTPTSGVIPDSTVTTAAFESAVSPFAPAGTYQFTLTTSGNDPLLPTHVISLSVRVVDSLTGVEGGESILPKTFALLRNEPNPFNPATRIAFDVAEERRVLLTVFDASGRRVTSLVDGVLPPGRHEVAWHGRDDSGGDVGSGIYFLRMEAGAFKDRIKMSLVR